MASETPPLNSCKDYLAWCEAPTPLQSGECFHFWGGFCEHGQSPHAGQVCPWEGRPANALDLTGRFDPPARRVPEIAADPPNHRPQDTVATSKD